MVAYLYDFLHFYYNNIKSVSELKKLLDDNGVSLDVINLILNNLGKKVQINIKDIGNCYENEVIINNNYIYFDSVDRFK